MYPFYPPPYGYGFQQQPTSQQPPNYQFPPTPSDLERGMKIALKLRAKEERKKQKEEDAKAKSKSDEKKKDEEAKVKTYTSLEWFIIGIILQPFVGAAYHFTIRYLETR